MRKYLVTILLVMCTSALWAGNPGFGERKYNLTVMGEYAYNKTWAHHANIDVQALMPIHKHFEMEAKLQFSTANVYTGALQLRPKFELPVGEMFIETDIMYRAIARNQMGDITAALGIGYRMDYVSVTVGVFGRVLDDWNRDKHTHDSFVCEPFNLLYRVEVFCRPQANPWNISFCIANVDDYQMERMWQPLFMAGAYYNVNDHWRWVIGAQCKVAGMFHLAANFYGANVRTGFTYTF